MGLTAAGLRSVETPRLPRIAKAPADRVNAWAREPGWSQIWLLPCRHGVAALEPYGHYAPRIGPTFPRRRKRLGPNSCNNTI